MLSLTTLTATSRAWLNKLFDLWRQSPLWQKVLLLVIALGLGWLAWTQRPSQNATTSTYQTAVAEKGTLVTSITGSGSITVGNSTNLTTSATGVVTKVLVSNGDQVKKGQAIATLELDDDSRAKRAAAWVAYLDAKEAVKTAQKTKVDADIAMWNARQAIFTAQDDIDYKNSHDTNPTTGKAYTDSQRVVVDKTLDQARAAFMAVELKYQNADSEIQSAQAKVATTWQDYGDLSPTITAPVAGVISNLSLAPDVTITQAESSDESSTTTTVTSQKIGQIDNPNGQFQASVSLTEIDIVKVQANQKVNLTLDAFPDLSFTGKVLAIDTSGAVSSGVTSYPVTILLDQTTARIYPRMAVSATIITNIKDNVILVPSTAVQSSNGSTTVQVMQDGQPKSVAVEVGDSNDSQIEIKSGLNGGETVVTSSVSATSQTSSVRNSNTASPFSSSFGGGFGGGPMSR